VIDSAFTSNSTPTSGQGGAIAHIGTSELRLLRSQFAQNTSGDAGAILCNGPCSIQQSSLADNRAAKLDAITSSSIGKGGAVLSNNALTVKRSAFLRNRGGSPGGGGIHTSAGSLDIENSLFANSLVENSAALPLSGSAVYASGTGTARIVYNTFANTAPNSVSAVSLNQAATLVDNIYSNYGLGIERLPTATGTAFENANLWHSVTVTGSAAVQHGAIVVFGNPLFVNPAASDFHIQSGSPAINAGVDVLVTVDFDDNTRPVGAAPDIGFDEVTVVSYMAYLPLVLR
jgi:hypothetical protein